jgi:hypothetical protein
VTVDLRDNLATSGFDPQLHREGSVHAGPAEQANAGITYGVAANELLGAVGRAAIYGQNLDQVGRIGLRLDGLEGPFQVISLVAHGHHDRHERLAVHCCR